MGLISGNYISDSCGGAWGLFDTPVCRVRRFLHIIGHHYTCVFAAQGWIVRHMKVQAVPLVWGGLEREADVMWGLGWPGWRVKGMLRWKALDVHPDDQISSYKLKLLHPKNINIIKIVIAYFNKLCIVSSTIGLNVIYAAEHHIIVWVCVNTFSSSLEIDHGSLSAQWCRNVCTLSVSLSLSLFSSSSSSWHACNVNNMHVNDMYYIITYAI